MKIRYIILASLVLFFIFLLGVFVYCKDYNGDFHYSLEFSTFHLNELISTESSSNILLVRFFHNKVAINFFDIFSRYIRFFDIGYLINILGIVGLFGLIYYFSIFFDKNIGNKISKIYGVILLSIPFLEIFQITNKIFPYKIIWIIIPYQVASFFGIYFFLKKENKYKYSIFFILLILSIIWIFVFSNTLRNFCII